MPVFVQVKCEGHRGALCVRNCGGHFRAGVGSEGPGVLHRLNRLGATAALSSRSEGVHSGGTSLRAKE